MHYILEAIGMYILILNYRLLYIDIKLVYRMKWKSTEAFHMNLFHVNK